MYVSSNLNFKVISENTLDANCKDIWVCVKNTKTSKKILIATIYRHPSSDTALFVQPLNNKIANLKISNYYAYFLSDFNSDVVSFPLSIFFNLFIEQECFPESLKLSKVINSYI